MLDPEPAVAEGRLPAGLVITSPRRAPRVVIGTWCTKSGVSEAIIISVYSIYLDHRLTQRIVADMGNGSGFDGVVGTIAGARLASALAAAISCWTSDATKPECQALYGFGPADRLR